MASDRTSDQVDYYLPPSAAIVFGLRLVFSGLIEALRRGDVAIRMHVRR